MQTGEVPGSRSGILKWLLAVLVALSSGTGISRLHAAANGNVWIVGRGGASVPSDELWLRDELGAHRFTGAVLSWCRPYALEDLTVSYLTAGYHCPRRALWLGWHLFHHPLYREDRLTMKASQRLLSGHLLLFCRSSGLFTRVRGFRSKASFEASFALFFISEGFLLAGIENHFIGHGRENHGDWLFAASAHIGPLMLVVNRDLAGGSNANTRIGIEAGLGDGLSLLSGYRLATDEISGGVLYTGRRLLVGISWSHHPVLGRTVSLGIGGVWLR